MLLAVLALFIAYPVLYAFFPQKNFYFGKLMLTLRRTFVQKVTGITDKNACKADPLCLSTDVALLKNIRMGLIDEDTPESEKTRTSSDGKTLKLVVRYIF